MKQQIFTLICLFLTTTLIATQNYNGKAITPQVEINITELLKKSFIINGNDPLKNSVFLQQNLANFYPGTWNVMIGIDSYSQTRYQNLNYSLNGQWWLHWYGKNPYRTEWIYGIQKVTQIYNPENNYAGSLSYSTTFGKGLSETQQNIIKNLFYMNHSVEELKALLNQYIQKGNWNILKKFGYSTQNLMAIFAKDSKWFTAYTDGYFYFAYLS